MASPSISFLSQHDVTASVCRESFRRFVHEFWSEVPGAGDIVWNWHMTVLCDELQKVAERVFRAEPREYDVVFNISPGTSKSTIASILFLPWTWTRMPRARHITASHTAELVLDFAYKSREVIRCDKYQDCFPYVRLRADREAKSLFMNTAGGDRLSCTVAGKTPMGFHAHFQTVDDPIDPRKAISELEMKSARQFMTEILPSRKVNKEVTPLFLIMQRLHREDPTAVLLETAKKDGARPIRHICLPAELADNVSPPEMRDLYTDGLMDQRRLSRRTLIEARANLGSYGYAGQYMQSPVPLGGGMFRHKWFTQRVRAAPYEARRVRFWDRAATSDGGCYSAGVLLAIDAQKKLYVEHVVHGQWEPNERNDQIVATALRDRTRYGPHNDPLIVIEAERGSTGLESFQALARRLMGFRIKEDQPTGSKDVRAEPWADQLAAMNVWLVEDDTWDLNNYVNEHVLFRPDPAVKRLGKYKDQVDASAGALRSLVQREIGPALRIINLGKSKQNVRLVVCSRDELGRVIIEHKAILVSIDSPRCGLPSQALGSEGEEPIGGEKPLSNEGCHSFFIDSLKLEFADVDPAERQESWGPEVSDSLFTREQAKKLWQFLLKKREPAASVVVFCDDGDRRAYALACGVCDSLRLPRSVVYCFNNPDSGGTEAPANQHAYQMVKVGRSLIV